MGGREKSYPQFNLGDEEDLDKIVKVAHAISVPERVKILKLIVLKSRSVAEISETLGLPFSSVARHVEILKKAGFIHVDYKPTLKGHVKYLSQKMLSFSVNLYIAQKKKKSCYEVEMPVGMFCDCLVSAPCGMAGAEGSLVDGESPELLYSPERAKAECIWLNSGYLTYKFPVPTTEINDWQEISFSFKICSECRNYNNTWLSDITLSVNDIELTTYTSPGDFGGRRGNYTPQCWELSNTQFGLLKNLTIRKTGVYLDDVEVRSDITIDSLKLGESPCITLKFEVKENAEHKGGMNIFGKGFGDFPQGIKLSLKAPIE